MSIVWTILLVIYFSILSIVATLSITFDGFWGSRKDGKLSCIIASALWPLILLFFIILSIGKLFKKEGS